jgi:hypothetical protein
VDFKTKVITALLGGVHGIKNNILVPLLGRVGTASATVLVASGADGEAASLVSTGLVALGLILFDLVVDWMGRSDAARKGRV